MKGFLLVFLCDLLLIHCSLISKSVIQRCSVGDTTEPLDKDGQSCARKFVLSMTLNGGQGNTDAIYGNVNTGYDADKRQQGILKKPFRVEIGKSEALVNYRVYYRGSVNAKPEEHIIVSSTAKCDSGWYSGGTTCGIYNDTEGRRVWDSQGFCCGCITFRAVTRVNVSCSRAAVGYRAHEGFGVLFKNESRFLYRSSAHCTNFSKLWYDVFEIESPNFHYNITVQLKELELVKVEEETTQKWTSISNFTLNPANPSGRSPSGTVVAQIEGDLIQGRGAPDLSTKMLLIPSLRAWHEDFIPPEYEKGPSDWLLVDQHLIDLSGEECNKVGASFTAFRNQPGRCYQLPNSCFSNQPSLLWKADDERRKHGIPGFYMMHNYGEIHRSTFPNAQSFIIRLVYPKLHNTFVTFRLDASDISFVVNVGKGRIVMADTRGFNRSTSSAGDIVTVIQNTGSLTQDYVVVLTKCFGREDLPSKKVTIQPGHSEVVVYSLLSRNKAKITANCEVQLYDQTFVLLGSAQLTFSVDAPCFCFGVCGCTCDEITGEVTNNECPTPPPVYVDRTSVLVKGILYILRLIGLHFIIGFFAGTLLVFGCIRLIFGGVIFCKKSKAQEHFDELKKKGADRGKGPALVKCTGECRGAKAAMGRVKRKAERLRKLGRVAHRLDNWANTTFVCSCNDEISDIRYMSILKALCFFYYLLILPFILLGKSIYWHLFADTIEKKRVAEKAALRSAAKKGPKELEKLGLVSIHGQLIQTKKEQDKLGRKKERTEKKMMEDLKKKEEKLKKKEKKKEEKETAKANKIRMKNEQHAIRRPIVYERVEVKKVVSDESLDRDGEDMNVFLQEESDEAEIIPHSQTPQSPSKPNTVRSSTSPGPSNRKSTPKSKPPSEQTNEPKSTPPLVHLPSSRSPNLSYSHESVSVTSTSSNSESGYNQINAVPQSTPKKQSDISTGKKTDVSLTKKTSKDDKPDISIAKKQSDASVTKTSKDDKSDIGIAKKQSDASATRKTPVIEKRYYSSASIANKNFSFSTPKKQGSTTSIATKDSDTSLKKKKIGIFSFKKNKEDKSQRNKPKSPTNAKLSSKNSSKESISGKTAKKK